jgi:energy-coupling factor transporter ATP-binding protein EcfA2
MPLSEYGEQWARDQLTGENNGHHSGYDGFFSDGTPAREQPEDFEDHRVDDWSQTTTNGWKHADNGTEATVGANTIPGPDALAFGAIDGGTFVFDEPVNIPAIWGQDGRVMWSEGESLMIAGQQGLGKTTLAGMLIRALLGLGDGTILGLTVTPTERPILYLAMDRPRQIARSMRRQFNADERRILSQRLIVRRGPPPADLAAHPTLLAAMAEHYDAGIVIVDSLKDAALGLSNDEVGAAWNRARQHLLAAERQLCELHHCVKRGPNGAAIKDINDVYGSAWLTNGCGSVILLTGEPGDPIVGFKHVKQPAEEVGPWQLAHDQVAGLLTVEHSCDLIDLVKASGADGLTAKDAAVAIAQKRDPSNADIEKARRKLEKLEKDGHLRKFGGTKGGPPAAWFLAARSDQ